MKKSWSIPGILRFTTLWANCFQERFLQRKKPLRLSWIIWNCKNFGSSCAFWKIEIILTCVKGFVHVPVCPQINFFPIIDHLFRLYFLEIIPSVPLSICIGILDETYDIFSSIKQFKTIVVSSNRTVVATNHFFIID